MARRTLDRWPFGIYIARLRVSTMVHVRSGAPAPRERQTRREAGAQSPWASLLLERGSRAAERWWGHDVQSPKERASPPNIAKGVGPYRVSAPSMRLSFGPMVSTTRIERG